MAISLTSTGVDFIAGRGRNKMVTLSLTFKDIERWAKRMGIDTGKLMHQSFGRACSGLKKRFYKVLENAGGVYGVPKFKDFEDFTKELRRVRRWTRPMGGVLAEPSQIVAYKRNGWQVIGWGDWLEKAAELFQDGVGGEDSEKLFTDPWYRRQLHKDGIKDVPRAYVHNPRRVLPEPFGSHVREHLDEWARGAFYKELARRMQKAGVK